MKYTKKETITENGVDTTDQELVSDYKTHDKGFIEKRSSIFSGGSSLMSKLLLMGGVPLGFYLTGKLIGITIARIASLMIHAPK